MHDVTKGVIVGVLVATIIAIGGWFISGLNEDWSNIRKIPTIDKIAKDNSRKLIERSNPDDLIGNTTILLNSLSDPCPTGTRPIGNILIYIAAGGIDQLKPLTGSSVHDFRSRDGRIAEDGDLAWDGRTVKVCIKKEFDS